MPTCLKVCYKTLITRVGRLCRSPLRCVFQWLAVVEVFKFFHRDTVGAWLSLVEHRVRDAGVGGSNPLAPTNFYHHIQITGFESRRAPSRRGRDLPGGRAEARRPGQSERAGAGERGRILWPRPENSRGYGSSRSPFFIPFSRFFYPPARFLRHGEKNFEKPARFVREFNGFTGFSISFFSMPARRSWKSRSAWASRSE